LELEPLLLRLFKRYGPIVTLRIGSSPFIFVAGRHLAHAALVGAGGVTLANRPLGVSNTLLGVNNIITRTDYGPVWRLLRRNLVGETLHPSRVRQFAPARARRLDDPAVRAIEDAERAWLVYISSPTQIGVFFFLLSITKHVFRGRLETARALRRRQKELFMPLINARREYKRQVEEEGQTTTRETTFQHSYVDTLLDTKLPEVGNRPLTDDEIVALCSEFLSAGTRTTSTALQWIMAEVVKNPAVQERLQAEIEATCGDDEVSEEAVQGMAYLEAVILEGLRKHPPGHFVLPHKAAEDTEIGGRDGQGR
ncbi:Cytochrome P450 89A2, partial [Dichanthelium oligosanthes]